MQNNLLHCTIYKFLFNLYIAAILHYHSLDSIKINLIIEALCLVNRSVPIVARLYKFISLSYYEKDNSGSDLDKLNTEFISSG